MKIASNVNRLASPCASPPVRRLTAHPSYRTHLKRAHSFKSTSSSHQVPSKTKQLPMNARRSLKLVNVRSRHFRRNRTKQRTLYARLKRESRVLRPCPKYWEAFRNTLSCSTTLATTNLGQAVKARARSHLKATSLHPMRITQAIHPTKLWSRNSTKTSRRSSEQLFVPFWKYSHKRQNVIIGIY